jgi:hypothetical protein
MKREDLMSARRWWSTAAVLALALGAACNEEFPQHPQLIVSLTPNPLDFGNKLVGTAPNQSLDIYNGGLEDLVLSSVTLSGAPQFTFYSKPAPTDAIEAKKHAFVVVIFTPTAATSYTSTLTINSNAENTPTLTVDVLGTGQ